MIPRATSLDKAYGELKAFLAKKGLKLTSERKRILELVFAMKHHIDVTHLYDEGRRRFPKAHLSLATIYRTIPLFEEMGFLKSFHTKEGHKLYECTYGLAHHDHIICLSCGSIAEFTCEEIEGYQLRVAKKHRYRLLDHRLELFGLCATCDSKEKET